MGYRATDAEINQKVTDTQEIAQTYSGEAIREYLRLLVNNDVDIRHFYTIRVDTDKYVLIPDY